MYPTGTVTFLFTDLEASSRLWDQYPEQMKAALARHDAILREGVEANQGVIVKTTGDGLHAVFVSPDDALQATISCQRALLSHEWGSTGSLQVRMGLHTGQAELREGDYYGPAVNRAARVMSVAAGGQVLLSMATAEVVRDHLPDDLALADLGRHRLRSLDRPERLFQLQHPELPADFPALKSLSTIPNNLPVQLTSFIGREEETAQIRKLLTPDIRQDDHAPAVYRDRLITLTGPGGTGKTRLSLQVAGELMDSFPDGIWLVELAPLADPGLVVQAAANPLNIREQPGRPLLDMLIDHLQSRKVLLILDNCEHVIDASAQLADALLRGCPELRILASSREALGIDGERAFRVRSLALPGTDELFGDGELAEYDAIRLFLTRAETVKSSFLLTKENALTILQICRRLDGIPLAIELAAARARVLTPEQILDRLDDRFRLLTGGSRTALPRQRTLQALVDWSYDLLSEEECVLLRRLSVFSGGWTLEAAESVTGIDPIEPYDVLDLLEKLHNKSLISVNEGDLGFRYRMLETIRQYAQLKLAESGEADEMRDRHLHYFVELTQEGAGAILSLRPADWVERLAIDLDNQRAARAWALDNDINSALRLMSGIIPRWSVIFPLPEAMHYLEKIIETAEALPQYKPTEANGENRRLLGAALLSAGNLTLALGTANTRNFTSRAEAIAREEEDVQLLVGSLFISAVSASFFGDFAAARDHHNEIRPLLANLENNWTKAMILVSFAHLFRSPDNPGITKAWENWQIGMAMFRQNGEFWGLAFGHQMASGVSFLLKNPEKSRYHSERSLEIYEELGDAHAANTPRSRLADLARQQGDLDQATSIYKIVVAGWRDVGQYGAMARCLECLAFVGRARAQDGTEAMRSLWLRRSTTLLGATESIRLSYNSPMNVLERSEYKDEMAKIKQTTTDELFEKAWQQGQAMDPDQAIDFMQEF